MGTLTIAMILLALESMRRRGDEGPQLDELAHQDASGRQEVNTLDALIRAHDRAPTQIAQHRRMEHSGHVDVGDHSTIGAFSVRGRS